MRCCLNYKNCLKLNTIGQVSRLGSLFIFIRREPKLSRRESSQTGCLQHTLGRQTCTVVIAWPVITERTGRPGSRSSALGLLPAATCLRSLGRLSPTHGFRLTVFNTVFTLMTRTHTSFLTPTHLHTPTLPSSLNILSL